jgi:hypothetical protein
MPVFPQQNLGVRAFELLHDLAHLLGRMVADEDMNMVSCDFAKDNLQLVLGGNSTLRIGVAHSQRDLPVQHPFSVFGCPEEMHPRGALRVRSQSVMSYSTTLHESSLLLKGRGFHCPRRGH